MLDGIPTERASPPKHTSGHPARASISADLKLDHYRANHVLRPGSFVLRKVFGRRSKVREGLRSKDESRRTKVEGRTSIRPVLGRPGGRPLPESLDAVLVHLAGECVAVDAEGFGGLGHAAVATAQDLRDE